MKKERSKEESNPEDLIKEELGKMETPVEWPIERDFTYAYDKGMPMSKEAREKSLERIHKMIENSPKLKKLLEERLEEVKNPKK